MRRSPSIARTFAVALVLSATGGCSLLPDAANPVEWYKGVRDWVGDGKTEAQRQAERTAESLPMPNQDASFPNLATVPERPERFYAQPSGDVERSLREDRREAIDADDEVRSRPADFGMAPEIMPATREPGQRTIEENIKSPPGGGPAAPRMPRRQRPPPPPDISDPPLGPPEQGSSRNGGGRFVPAALSRTRPPRRDLPLSGPYRQRAFDL